MKKVLSVLLAAAMVMGMSVSAFAADKEWGKGPEAGTSNVPVVELEFDDDMLVTRKGSKYGFEVFNSYDDDGRCLFIAGDVLYFPIMTDGVPYEGQVDADWTINIKANDYVTSAEFVAIKDLKADTVVEGKLTDDSSFKCVKITLDKTYDDVDKDEVDFYFYIADTDKDNWVGGKKAISEKGIVHGTFDNWTVEHVDFDFVNDVDHASKWVVKKDEKGTATFSFNNDAYFVVKMIPEEKVVLNFSDDYVKAIDKAFGYEADLEFYNFKGTSDEFTKKGELVIAADEDTFIYAWDGEKLVEVEAEYVEDYKFDNGKKVDGWVIETNELGFYVVSDIEAEIEAEAEVEAPVEADKANPETGAADFVGAAVAMAVVSVAAAGALALKK